MKPGERIATATVGRWSIRLYASPRTGPDHPWASWADLMAVAGWGDGMQAHWWEKMSQEVPEMLHTLPDGTRVVAQPMVGGLFQAWVWMGAEPAQKLLDEWGEAWSAVFAAQHAHLSPEEMRDVAQEAGLRNVPRVTGHVMQ